MEHDLQRRLQCLARRLGQRLSQGRFSFLVGKTCGVCVRRNFQDFRRSRRRDAKDEDIQRIVSDLLVKYPRLVDTQRNRSQGDPFVIATAEALNAVVVTGEKSGKPDSPKIPDVCNARKIRPISFLEMLRELEWKF